MGKHGAPRAWKRGRRGMLEAAQKRCFHGMDRLRDPASPNAGFLWRVMPAAVADLPPFRLGREGWNWCGPAPRMRPAVRCEWTTWPKNRGRTGMLCVRVTKKGAPFTKLHQEMPIYGEMGVKRRKKGLERDNSGV